VELAFDRAAPPMKPDLSVSAVVLEVEGECFERRFSLLKRDFTFEGEVGDMGLVSSEESGAESLSWALATPSVVVVVVWIALGTSRDFRLSSFARRFSSARFSFSASFSCRAARFSSSGGWVSICEF
jgi:hypothetical protein